MPDRCLAVLDDEIVRCAGRLLGRVSLVQSCERGWYSFDWYGDPAGTHDMYVLEGRTYAVEVADG